MATLAEEQQPADKMERVSVVGWQGRKHYHFAVNSARSAAEQLAAKMALEGVVVDDPYRGLAVVVHYSPEGRDLAGWIVVNGYSEAVLCVVCEEVAQAKPGWLTGAMRKNEAGDSFIHVLVPDPPSVGFDWRTFIVLTYRLCTALNAYPASGSLRYLQSAPADIRLLQEAVYGTEEYVALPPTEVSLLRAADHPIVCTGGPGQLVDSIRRTLAQPISESDLTWAAKQLELPGKSPENHSQIHLGVEWHRHSPPQR